MFMCLCDCLCVCLFVGVSACACVLMYVCVEYIVTLMFRVDQEVGMMKMVIMGMKAIQSRAMGTSWCLSGAQRFLVRYILHSREHTGAGALYVSLPFDVVYPHRTALATYAPPH